jgi:uncharacterized membrane protein
MLSKLQLAIISVLSCYAVVGSVLLCLYSAEEAKQVYEKTGDSGGTDRFYAGIIRIVVVVLATISCLLTIATILFKKMYCDMTHMLNGVCIISWILFAFSAFLINCTMEKCYVAYTPLFVMAMIPWHALGALILITFGRLLVNDDDVCSGAFFKNTLNWLNVDVFGQPTQQEPRV